LSVDNEICIAWLERALQRLRSEGQEKVEGYLEAVLEEVLFETKVRTRGAPRLVSYRKLPHGRPLDDGAKEEAMGLVRRTPSGRASRISP
jgi:hypothetical protein